jgi:hypothetical protein
MVHHLTVAKDVPSTKKQVAKKPVTKRSKKATVKKAPASKAAAASAQYHPPVVQP